MRQLFLSTLLLVLGTLFIQAAPAFREPVTVIQPDGTTLVITLHGDEHAAWTTTTDGTLVVRQQDGYYVAAISDDGRLTATTLLAHQPHQRSSAEQTACQAQQQRHALFYEQTGRSVQAARRAQVTGTSYFPHSGSPKCLVILVNFSDNAFSSTDPTTQFKQYFSGETQENLGHNEDKNLVSVKKYFQQSSNGKFTPEFTIVGPYTLPQTMEYYGGNTSSSPASDKAFGQFCKDAIALADKDVDFKDFDNIGDNKAELVCIIYAGYGESVGGNPTSTLWPKCGYQGISTEDGVTVNYMNCSPELFRVKDGTNINGIGLFCHEFSHGTGLPDHYATVNAAKINNQTPEFWDLMDYGEYANDGYAPVPYTAWERSVMGWTELEALTTSQTGIELTPVIKGGKAYKVCNPEQPEEMMIIENVQARDRDNKISGYVYGHGMLVWHIDYSSYKNSAGAYVVSMSDYPNNKAEKPLVTIVPADGLVINGYQFGDDKEYNQTDYISSLRGDPFPGTSTKTSLDASMQLPNFVFYNGETTPAFKLANITEDETAGKVIFDFDNGTPTGIRTVAVSDIADDAFYTIDGRRLTGKPTEKGLYIHQNKKIMVR